MRMVHGDYSLCQSHFHRHLTVPGARLEKAAERKATAALGTGAQNPGQGQQSGVSQSGSQQQQGSGK